MEKMKEGKYSVKVCMGCDKVPVYEVIWANGHGHAWFCRECLLKWAKESDRDVSSVKKITKDNVASKDYADNKNPNIQKELKLSEVGDGCRPLKSFEPMKVGKKCQGVDEVLDECY